MPSLDPAQLNDLNPSAAECVPEISRPPLVVILGPTAVGKSEISIQLAERLNGEIVSADSRLFYRGMDIGTAKPTLAERSRVPHHLIDVAAPDQVWSLAVFQQHAREAIAGVHRRNRLPFLVGGTGQYVRSVTHGWDLPQVAPHPPLRAAMQRWSADVGADGLHDRLTVVDPQAARTIDPRNLRRTMRALEVILVTGRRFSEQRRSGLSSYRLLLLGLSRPRSELYARIDARIDAMMAAGFVLEVQSLLQKGYSPELPAFSAIGYREIVAHLGGQLTLDEAVTGIKRATRTFVRRQANWFKADDPQIHWFQVGGNTVDQMVHCIESCLFT